MRILVASSNLGSNGASIFARRSLMLLHKAGYEVLLACQEDSWVGRDLPADLPVIRTNFHRWPFDECDRVAAWCRERGVSLVHSHLTRSCNFGALLRQRHGIKSIAHLHANHPQIHTGFHDLLIAVSEDVARRHRMVPWNWTAEIVTVPNFVDDEEFRPAASGEPDLLRSLLDVSADTPVLLSVVRSAIAKDRIRPSGRSRRYGQSIPTPCWPWSAPGNFRPAFPWTASACSAIVGTSLA